MFSFLTILFFVFLAFIEDRESKKTLRVLTYSSFAGLYGPGKDIKTQFELFCECEIQWFLAEDSTALLQRLFIIPKIDLVLGWDQITLKAGQKEMWENLSLFKEDLLAKNKNLDLESAFFSNPYFLPIDWAPIGFLYKKPGFSSLKSLRSLPEIKGQVSFPEPRTSSLGLQWYYWIYEVFEGELGPISDFLKRLKKKVYGPFFSWSMAYGLFQKDKTNMSLSYLSSLLYHQEEEPEKSYFFSVFKEGHAYQVEYVSIPQNSQNKSLALKFAKFLLSPKAQQILQEEHYMFPVSISSPVHKLLKQSQLKVISYKYLDAFLTKQKDLLSLWEKSLY